MKGFWCIMLLVLCSWKNASAQTNSSFIWEKNVVDTCVVIPMGVDFGLCAMPLGWALSDSGCVMLSGCSMIGSDGIDYSTSFFQSSYQCNGACLQDTTIVLTCVDSSLIDSNICCLDVYDPVCGCDSVTYSNSCWAMFQGGVLTYTSGTCESAGIYPKWMTQISVQPNPFTSKLSFIADPSLNLTIRLYHSTGQIILTQQCSGSFLEFDGGQLAPGTYFVEITNLQSGQKVVKRVVKE
ncbi:MAG: T9SS type A sorting domain-containing protein [Flavobacteriales bacterium]